MSGKCPPKSGKFPPEKEIEIEIEIELYIEKKFRFPEKRKAVFEKTIF